MLIAEDDIIRHHLTIIALTNLCDLLIEEFLFSGDTQILTELQKHTRHLIKIANEQKSQSLIFEAQHIRILAIWLQTQHSMIDVDTFEIQSLLKNSQQMAERKGLSGLAKRIFNKHKNILDHLELWDDSLQEYFELIKA